MLNGFKKRKWFWYPLDISLVLDASYFEKNVIKSVNYLKKCFYLANQEERNSIFSELRRRQERRILTGNKRAIHFRQPIPHRSYVK